MRTNLFLFILLLLEVFAASCCEKQRNTQVIEYVNQKAVDYTDQSILKALDSAKVKFRLSNDEVRCIKRTYQIK